MPISRPLILIPAVLLIALGSLVFYQGVVAPGGFRERSPAGFLTQLREDGAARRSGDAPRISPAPEAPSYILGADTLGTYLNDILAGHDSVLVRWPERVADPVRVWIQRDDSLEGWSEEFTEAARSAFDEWETVGIPVRFRYVPDSSAAEIQVRWTDWFDAPVNAETSWTHDSAWWIVHAQLNLGVRSETGEVLGRDAIHALALHEVGHALGLDHSRAALSIMGVPIRTGVLADIDTATVRRLYTLRPGPAR